jgi:hypothetical protein
MLSLYAAMDKMKSRYGLMPSCGGAALSNTKDVILKRNHSEL